ncbi:MAG: chemotaxis response regulator protein-glutamate methylesterase [Clostridium sp.]|nr:chemotaxis response regulator protein-glutamate methylesterase [Clostridium sp.]
MAKKILVVDDSALMRSVLCDIINQDQRFQVADIARNGLEALDLLTRKTYDAVVLDVNMPKMGGLELLQELRRYKIPAKVLMASTDTKEGAKTTLDALDLGAIDFIHKPTVAVQCRTDHFRKELTTLLDVISNSRPPSAEFRERFLRTKEFTDKIADIMKPGGGLSGGSVMGSSRGWAPVGGSAAGQPGSLPVGKRLVAIASSTGGPRALQAVVPRLPAELNAPVLVVQHMPKGFTTSLAERLNAISPIAVKEAAEGDELRNGVVYLAMGGKHMQVGTSAAGRYTIRYSDEPYREGVKPCANYMYESLAKSRFDEILCVVMTGMGMDGTVGIRNLEVSKKVHVIAQNQETCIVYGMPKSIVESGLSDQVVPLEQIAQEIISYVGVTQNGS